MSKTSHYIGRFAPSPTGPLHFGSMVAAIGSYLQARREKGIWRVRIEDLDPPRELPGASDAILYTLERFGLEWDEEIIYQSQRTEAYLEALARLRDLGKLYPCDCSRKEISEHSPSGQYGPIYSGLCRNGSRQNRQPQALRVLTHNQTIMFSDRLRGSFEQRIESEVGDFVVRRADRLFAYQLAVVVDDAEQGITEVVRGSDLLYNTPRQIHLQQLLGYTTPDYVHLPVALNSEGQKLSKQAGAKGINDSSPPGQLIAEVLTFLGQTPPDDLASSSLGNIWRWAIENWRLENVPRQDQIILSV